MFDADKLPELPAYACTKEEKQAFLTRELCALTRHHAQSCPEYGKLLRAFGHTADELEHAESVEELPYLPVRLFKEYRLKSVADENVFRTMTSSGTTGQQVSRIFLDRETSTLQSKVLSRIMGEFLGKQRLPMIILDTSAVIKDRSMFSARGAGLLGFSMFGRDKIYALDENMQLDIDGLKAFLEKHEGEDLFLFGFTFMIWQHFCTQLRKTGYHPDLSRGVLIHGGGWKKLADQHITTEQFHRELYETCSITRVHDYYGMVEQTGTIYMECEHGHLHAPLWSDIIVRKPTDLSPAAMGEKGLIEVVSLLPHSYPGHILLTEDEGRILGEDDCPCGRKGKYFEILGRIQKAEVRGCSDTYEQKDVSCAVKPIVNEELLSACKWLCGGNFDRARPLPVFSENVTAFLNDLSTALLQDKEAKLYPDVVTFAFFCRKGNLERLRGDYEAERNTRIGRGLAFHIAPGNVPINFAYSLVAALLSGCPSVVKASSRDFAQTRIVCRVMTALLEDKHPHMKPYVNVVMYDRARQDITQWFSERCAARIVWGGDETVRRVRTALLAPRAVEVTFADRYSLLVIDADKLNAMTDSELAALSQGFYNDTYLTDQAACTSPQLIYWLGDDEAATEAKIRFWDAVRKHTSARYTVEAVTAVDKLTAACRAAIDLAGTHIEQEKDALITRVSVETLSDKLPAYRCHGGYFTEYTAQTLEPLADIVTPRYQTLSYIGLDADALRAFVRTHGLTGIDRISPVGHTMDFSLVWDGYDLVKTLSRQIYAF